jgi:hypothetical protein
LTNEKHPYGSLIRAPTTFQGRPSKRPSQITMPKPKEKERIMLLSLLGTPRKKEKRKKKDENLPQVCLKQNTKM